MCNDELWQSEKETFFSFSLSSFVTKDLKGSQSSSIYSHHSLVLIFALQLNLLTLARFYDEDKIVD